MTSSSSSSSLLSLSSPSLQSCPLSLSVCLSIFLSFCLSVCLSLYLFLSLSVYLSLFLSLSLSISPSLFLSVCLSLYLSVCLSFSHTTYSSCIYVCVYTISAWSDWVRCFCCGIGVREWAPGDDPWAEHARWSPRCSFVRLMGKSQSSYDECSSRHESHENKVSFSLEHFVK